MRFDTQEDAADLRAVTFEHQLGAAWLPKTNFVQAKETAGSMQSPSATARRANVRPLTGSLLFSFAFIATAIGAQLADYSSTHLFNANRPGHAKPHNGSVGDAGRAYDLLCMPICR